MNNSKNNDFITEEVFGFGGEGGSIGIYRQRNQTEEKFLYRHNESDLGDEDIVINIEKVYQNFEEPFQVINSKYAWYSLFITTVHEDYRDYIIKQLIKSLNKGAVSESRFYFGKDKLEDILKINLTCKVKNNKPIWSYTKSNKQRMWKPLF